MNPTAFSTSPWHAVTSSRSPRQAKASNPLIDEDPSCLVALATELLLEEASAWKARLTSAPHLPS